MKYFNLSAEEKSLLEEFERGDWKEVKNLAQAKRKYQQYVKNTLNKTKNINIRLSLKDIQRLKTQAVENGLPYQTLVSAVLHSFANKKISLSF
jgi:predicted DNA binding CopG/RHH family protein